MPHLILDLMPKCVVLSSPLHSMLLPTGWQCSISASYGNVLLAPDWETTGVVRPSMTSFRRAMLFYETLALRHNNSLEALT